MFDSLDASYDEVVPCLGRGSARTGAAEVVFGSDALRGQLGRQDVIVRFPLTDREAKLTLDQLAKLHPVPIE
jgi:hypothetical protein